MERVKVSPRNRRQPCVGGERENSEQQKLQGAEYRWRGTLADSPVVAVKPGNAGGAKGRGCSG